MEELIRWCHKNNATVRFKNPNGVEVKIPHIHKVYAYNLADAVKALKDILLNGGGYKELDLRQEVQPTK